jgi:hypothetical protein
MVAMLAIPVTQEMEVSSRFLSSIHVQAKCARPHTQKTNFKN